MVVGSGIGPTTLPLFRSAVSMICLQELSISLWSYAAIFSRSFEVGSSVFFGTLHLYNPNLRMYPNAPNGFRVYLSEFVAFGRIR